MCLKWLLKVCFSAVINELVIEYEKRKEVNNEAAQAPEKSE